MSAGQHGSGRRRSGSRLSRLRSQEHPGGDYSDNDEIQGMSSRTLGSLQGQMDSCLSRSPFSNSLNQKTPARSYYQHSFPSSLGDFSGH